MLAPSNKVSEIQGKADVLVLSLREGVGKIALPSKIVSYMFSKKPVLAIVERDCDIEKNISVTASLVVEGLDVDGSGTIEWNEFVDWIIAGVSTSNYARKKLSSESEINKKLLFFLEYISEIAKAITP